MIRHDTFLDLCATWDGRIYRASKRETAKTTITTTGSGHQYLPVVPGINNKGTKASIVERKMKITGI
jgi:hypothetical protein